MFLFSGGKRKKKIVQSIILSLNKNELMVPFCHDKY